MTPSWGRTAAAGAAVLAAALLSVAAARGVSKPHGGPAPEFRQKGAPAAPIVIEQFSDFECPACRYAEEPLRQIVELYGDKVRVVFKHFPLERPRPTARHAAAAAECAGRQGRFWPVLGALFDKQAEWSRAGDPDAAIDAVALAAGLDQGAYAACMSDPAVAEIVSADVREGRHRFVNSTPTFFINGKRFVGGKQLQTRGNAWIEKQLKAAK